MTNEIIIKEYLSEYVHYILRFENALKSRYDLQDNPYEYGRDAFPRTGQFEAGQGIFIYRFHGGGCSFEYNNIEVGYDYHIISEDYLTTVPWKFWRFVETYSDAKESPKLTLDEVGNALEALSNTAAIRKLYPEYSVYQISFLWLKSFASRQ